MSAKEHHLQETIAILLLFLPLAMHWLLPEGEKWEQAFTTISRGSFRYNWIIVFYILYYFLYPKYNSLMRGKKIILLFLIGLSIAPFPLLLINNGDYAYELLLSALPFYIVPCIILAKPPQKDSFKALKIPLCIIITVTIYFYLKSITISQLVINVHGRPDTLIGGINASSYFIAILVCLMTELYVNSDWIKVIILFFTLALIMIGACRGAFLLLSLYILIYIYRTYKHTTSRTKFLIFIILSFAIYYTYNSNISEKLTERNEEIDASGDVTTGRGEKIKYTLATAFVDSPIIGVGHGRVFPSSKDLQRIRDVKKIIFSSYNGAPHNTYVLAMAESGIVGIILIFIGVIWILKSLNYQKNLSYLVVLLLFTMGNTEVILIQDDFWPLFWILFSLSVKQIDNQSIYKKEECTEIATKIPPTLANTSR